MRLWIRFAQTIGLISCLALSVFAQARGGQRGGPPPTAKSLAPIDLTGYWTAVVTEDWHVRMTNAPKGDLGSGVGIKTPGMETLPNIPYKPKGEEAANAEKKAGDTK